MEELSEKIPKLLEKNSQTAWRVIPMISGRIVSNLQEKAHLWNTERLGIPGIPTLIGLRPVNYKGVFSG